MFYITSLLIFGHNILLYGCMGGVTEYEAKITIVSMLPILRGELKKN